LQVAKTVVCTVIYTIAKSHHKSLDDILIFIANHIL